MAVKTDNLDNTAWAAINMYLARVQRLESYLKAVRERKKPTLYIYSENDRLVDMQIFNEMTEMLTLGSKLENHEFVRYDKGSNLVANDALKESWLRIMAFEAAGHYSFVKESQKVNHEIASLLGKVRNDWQVMQEESLGAFSKTISAISDTKKTFAQVI